MWCDYAQCGKYRNSLSHFFDKNFVKVTFLLAELPAKSWFDEIFFGEREFLLFSHCSILRIKKNMYYVWSYRCDFFSTALKMYIDLIRFIYSSRNSQFRQFICFCKQWRRKLWNIGEALGGYIFWVDFYCIFERFEEMIPISKSQILGRLEPHGPHC